MRTIHRVAAIAAAAALALAASAGIAFAGDKTDKGAGHGDVCFVGSRDSLVNAQVLNCADVDVLNHVLNNINTLNNSLNDLVDL